jgi:hypothetical protein
MKNIAQSLDAIQSAGLPGNTVPSQIGPFINRILLYVAYGAGIALLIYLVTGGLQLMTSRGDPKGIQAAQAKITNALIGFVIIAFAATIVAVLGKVFGIKIFEDIFNP